MRKIKSEVDITLRKQINLNVIESDNLNVYEAVERVKMSVKNKFGKDLVNCIVNSIEVDGKNIKKS